MYTGQDGPSLKRGEELGMFHLGSTVIVFTGPGSGLTLAQRPGQALRMGEALFRRSAAAASGEVNP